jgi:hypothetical protein
VPAFPNQPSFRRVEPVRPEFIQAAASSIPHNSPSAFTNPLYFSCNGVLAAMRGWMNGFSVRDAC